MKLSRRATSAWSATPPIFNGILSVFSLQPAPDACLVPRVLLTEARFEIALLARYDDEVRVRLAPS